MTSSIIETLLEGLIDFSGPKNSTDPTAQITLVCDIVGEPPPQPAAGPPGGGGSRHQSLRARQRSRARGCSRTGRGPSARAASRTRHMVLDRGLKRRTTIRT
ncbi:hypothetical protein QTP88_005288 [Uroleucon formosanum]